MITRRNFSNLIVKGLIFSSYSLLVSFLSNSTQASDVTPKPYQSTFERQGLHSQSWFVNSFFDLKDDLEDATAQGKRFAIIWELAGCPYCRETHLVNFALPDISNYIKKNFEVLQLDLRGSREVIDFDGKKLTERELAKRNNIRFTPTIQFFSEELKISKNKKSLEKIEVSRMPGYFRPQHFLEMFKYVHDKGYEVGNYHSYLKAKETQ